MRFTFLPLLAMLLAAPGFAQTTAPTEGAGPVVTAVPAHGKKAHVTAHRRTAKQRFAEANTTKDGKLTLEQAEAGNMKRVSKNFAAIDSGHKGYVTMADIKAYNKARRAERRAKGD